jgi:integrase
MADQLERLTPGTASARYGWLHVFFRWCVEVGELEADPMAHMHKPPTPDTPPPIPSVEDLKRLLHTCAGRGNDAQEAYHNRRDLAIFYLLLDTGMRRSEVCRLTWDDVDMTSGRVTIIGKRANGQDRTRYGRLGMASLSALDAYKRYRRGHKYASLPNIFLAQRGALTGQGVYDIVRRRAEQAGLDLRPHRFRHYFAHAWLAAGGSEGGLRALGGWRSDVMRRYGASLASERALSEHERLAPGDRL